MKSIEEIVAEIESELEGAREHSLNRNYPQALEHFQHALELCERHNDIERLVSIYVGIGNVYRETSHYPQALKYFQKVLSIEQDRGASVSLARATNSIGIIYGSIGDHQQALDYYLKAIKLYEAIDSMSGVAGTMKNLGAAYHAVGDYHQAMDYMRKANKLHESLGSSTSATLSALNLANVHMAFESYDEAETLLQSLSDDDVSDLLNRSFYLDLLAGVAQHKGQLDEARQLLQDALQIAHDNGMRSSEVSILRNLRDLTRKRGDFDAFVEHNAEFLRITEEIGGRETTQKMAVLDAERKIESELRERDRERALLYGELPKAIAERMLRGENVNSDHHNNSSVLFLDIVGFTTMSDTMPPNEVVAMLGEVFAVMDRVANRHGVTKIKTIGDSYMAVAF